MNFGLSAISLWGEIGSGIPEFAVVNLSLVKLKIKEKLASNDLFVLKSQLLELKAALQVCIIIPDINKTLG